MTCFSSVDESAHYGASVAMLLGRYRAELGWDDEGVVELGSGDASAVAETVAALPGLRVRGFDISADSVDRARANIAAHGVADRYTVEVGDFFDQMSAADPPPVRTAIANPPYIPAPDGDILGARVADEGVKFALIADDPGVYFTTPHFDGYPAVLVRLAEIGEAELSELITEAWLAQAPKSLAKAFLQNGD